jgi:putative YphP/YqiW family bacilliredoxin
MYLLHNWYLCTLKVELNTRYMYPPELVKPMREDLTNVGFEELHTTEAVESALAKEGTTLVVVNSVCGCAAANARPGAPNEFTKR